MSHRRSLGSKALGGYLGKWPLKLWPDSPILISPCLCLSCIVSHWRRKRPQCDPSSPRDLGRVHSLPVQSSDMLSLGWCGAGTSGRWMPVGTSVQTHCLPPSGLALLLPWGSLPWHPSFCCGQWLHSLQGYLPGARTGCHWWHCCILSGKACKRESQPTSSQLLWDIFIIRMGSTSLLSKMPVVKKGVRYIGPISMIN